MAKKLFGLSVFLWILIALVVLFFVYGVGRMEGFNPERRPTPPKIYKYKYYSNTGIGRYAGCNGTYSADTCPASNAFKDSTCTSPGCN